MKLNMSEEVVLLMEGRGIKVQDVENVISHAESTGEKFVEPASGRFLASLRPGRVTYWVEYGTVADGFEVFTAYSHRMEMKRSGVS
jgi:glutamate synthase (NADPH) small chain